MVELRANFSYFCLLHNATVGLMCLVRDRVAPGTVESAFQWSCVLGATGRIPV